MPTYNPLEGIPIKYQYVNPDIPTGNTVTSSVTNNPKTAFSSSALIPESSANIGGVARIDASGLYGSGIASTALTITVEMAGVIVATAAITPALSLSNMPWNISVSATILNNGQIEIQGKSSFSSSLSAATVINIRNMTPFTMSTAGGVSVIITAQYGALALGGTITLRQMIVSVT